MALKKIRVIARRTTYFYIEVEANSKIEAIEKGWQIPQEDFIEKNCPQDEWRVVGAAIMEKGEPVDDLKCLSPTTIKK